MFWIIPCLCLLGINLTAGQQKCTFLSAGLAYEGINVDAAGNVQSASECCDRCSRIRMCMAFMYNPKSRKCIFMGSLTGNVVRLTYDHIQSGMRVAWPPEAAQGFDHETHTSLTAFRAHGQDQGFMEQPQQQFQGQGQAQQNQRRQEGHGGSAQTNAGCMTSTGTEIVNVGILSLPHTIRFRLIQTVDDCCNLCSQHQYCRAWTFYGAPQFQCSLKRRVPPPGRGYMRRNPHAVSGVRATQQQHNRGKDTVEQGPAAQNLCLQNGLQCRRCEACVIKACNGQPGCINPYACDAINCEVNDGGFPGVEDRSEPGQVPVEPVIETQPRQGRPAENVCADNPCRANGPCHYCMPMHRVCFEEPCVQYQCMPNNTCIEISACAAAQHLRCSTLQECRLAPNRQPFCAQKPIYDPRLEPKCHQSIKQGRCKAYFPVWGYNWQNNVCQSFIYGGCEGNENQFATPAECKAACISVPNVQLQCGTSHSSACEREHDCNTDADCRGVLKCCSTNNCGKHICTQPIAPTAG